MKAGEQARYLDALDGRLLPLGYRRQRRESVWRRMEARDRLWVHLNIGVGVINPSVGVCYTDMAELLPAESGANGTVLNTGLNLTTLSGRQYTDATSAERLATDLARIFHETPAAAADLCGVTRSAPADRLDVVSTTPSPLSGPRTAPRRVLGALATYAHEISGLTEIGLAALTKLRDCSAVIDRLASGKPSDWPVAGTMIRMRLLPLLLADQGRVDEALAWVAAFEKEPDQMIPGYATFAACFSSRFAGSQDRP